jgi:hypothetical protein
MELRLLLVQDDAEQPDAPSGQQTLSGGDCVLRRTAGFDDQQHAIEVNGQVQHAVGRIHAGEIADQWLKRVSQPIERLAKEGRLIELSRP